MKSTMSFELKLTGIIVPDERTGLYSAFFAEFPEAIAQGESVEDAQKNLQELFVVMLQDKKGEAINYLPNDKYITRELNMVQA